MHDLVGQHPGQRCRVQRIDEFGVVVKRHTIGRHGWNRPLFSPFQAKQERTKERMVQQKRGTRFLNANQLLGSRVSLQA